MAAPRPPGLALADARGTVAPRSGASVASAVAFALATCNASRPPATTGASAASVSAGTTDDDWIDAPTTTSGGSGCARPDLGDRRCDVYLFIDGCPEGQKCVWSRGDGVSYWTENRCVPLADDPLPLGAACTPGCNSTAWADDRCDLGLECYGGRCVPLCAGAPAEPTCPEGLVAENFSNGWCHCLAPCHPLVQDCGPGDRCLPGLGSSGTFVCSPDRSGAADQERDPCEYADGCDPGLMCVDPSLAAECDQAAAGCCLPFCSVTAGDCHGQDQQCLPWYEHTTAPPGYDDVGVCGIPP
ncbi:hypothetical protein [Nannocystis pusilla]|uniref:Uncharacterized protein n=1 Tax=Nannocystis pusilla TaxID=889268 RepID=A0ABS7TWV7_9BACT|nr:hypothetical protein [Nannocystis pusilla]MBZ5712747.1 hypothetical protein [Nannocystis pusilla]